MNKYKKIFFKTNFNLKFTYLFITFILSTNLKFSVFQVDKADFFPENFNKEIQTHIEKEKEIEVANTL